MEKKMKRLLILALIVSMCALGCATPQNKKEKGTRIGVATGAIAGALLGQAIGGDTAGTLIGAGIGAFAGGAIGRKVGSNMDEQEAAMREQLAAVEAANIQRNADMLAVTFKADALFDVDSTALKPRAFDEIQRVSTVLNQYPQTSIIVSGHTDSTGSEDYNLMLSEGRAMSVKNALAGQGVSLSRITTVGFGEATPIANNNTEAGRQLNRRVVVTIKSHQG
jgi:outer membrane protein OmpA-like peptidoglycan-associated protein